MAHAVLDVVSENPEEKTIPEEMDPASVKEHRDERSKDVYLLIVDDARQPVTEGHTRTESRLVCDLAGNHPEIANARSELWLVEAGALYEHPRPDERRENGVRHVRGSQGRELVA